MSSLHLSGLHKSFGVSVALDGFDLEMNEGELVTLLGPSGCGKTTALRITAGFESADEGRVVIGGNDITRLPAHRRAMGMVFQGYSLFPNLSVVDNIDFGLRTRGDTAADRRRRVREMLDLVDLGEHAAKFPHQLSGGQQQRVALARALAVEPRVLLLDEPLSALDAKVRSTLRDEIRRIQTEVGITTLFVTHDQDEALAISDRVCVMSHGRIEQLGRPTEVYREPATPFVARFVGTMNEFEGTVCDEGRVSLAGVEIAAPLVRGVGRGSAGRLLVRPEDLSISDSGLRATVMSLAFHGATTVVGLSVHRYDRRVVMEMPSTEVDAVRVGTDVFLSIAGDRSLWEAM